MKEILYVEYDDGLIYRLEWVNPLFSLKDARNMLLRSDLPSGIFWTPSSPLDPVLYCSRTIQIWTEEE